MFAEAFAVDASRTLKSARLGTSGKSTKPRKNELEEYQKDGKNASRDVHKRFVSLGLSMPIRITPMEHRLEASKLTTHWVRPTDWFRTLLLKSPHSLMGDTADWGLQLEAFWALYQHHHAEHTIFRAHSNDMKCTIPVCLFGDEGRGPKRGNFLMWSIESAIGLKDLPDDWSCSCKDELDKLLPTDLTDWKGNMKGIDDNLFRRALKQMTNMKGHSYTTRHMLFGIPHWLYKDEGSTVLENHIEALTDDMNSLYWNGVEVGGQTYYGALIGFKGDMKHHLSLGLNRSYHKLRGGMMCSLCEAGAPGIGFESHLDQPPWETTMYSSRPWDVQPVVCSIPFNSQTPERAFVLDPFHLFKLGLARDLAGSMIVYLARTGSFDDDTLNPLIDRVLTFVGCLEVSW